MRISDQLIGKAAVVLLATALLATNLLGPHKSHQWTPWPTIGLAALIVGYWVTFEKLRFVAVAFMAVAIGLSVVSVFFNHGFWGSIEPSNLGLINVGMLAPIMWKARNIVTLEPREPVVSWVEARSGLAIFLVTAFFDGLFSARPAGDQIVIPGLILVFVQALVGFSGRFEGRAVWIIGGLSIGYVGVAAILADPKQTLFVACLGLSTASLIMKEWRRSHGQAPISA